MKTTTDDYDERDWLNRLRKIQRNLARNGWELETLKASIKERVEAMRKKGRKSSRASRRRSGTARRSNVRNAKECVSRVVIEHDADGWMLAHVENIGLPVELKGSQRLRELLLALCGKVSETNRPDDSGVVPFKTSGELIEAIKDVSGEAITVGNLQNLVQILRDLLTEANVDPGFVETGGGGYRFRLRMNGKIHEQGR